MWELASGGLLNRLLLTTWCEQSVHMCLSRRLQRNSARGVCAHVQREIYYAELLTLVVMRADKSQDRSWQAELGPGQVAVLLQLSAH